MAFMRVKCRNCSTTYRVDDSHGGKWGVCALCRARTQLPIPDPKRLIEYACTVPWGKLKQFYENDGARGHTEETIREFVRVVEQRRWATWDAGYANRAAEQHRPVLTQRERIWAAAERRFQWTRTLEQLCRLDPYDFERFVASLFTRRGYDAHTVGGSGDDGIDVVIREKAGDLWGVAQCKRYVGHKISARDIRAFVGAFELSKAQHGFYFTTTTLTRHAKRTARGFPWLTVYNGPRLVEFVEESPQHSLPDTFPE